MGWLSNYWLLTSILSAIFFAVASFIITIGAKKHYSISQMLVGLYISGAVMFAFYISLHNGFSIDKQTFMWGIIIGIGSSLSNAFFTYALKLGPVSLTGPLANTNVILVIIMSVFYYGEILSLPQILGISLLLLGCFLLPFDPQENKHVRKNMWFLIMLLTIFFMFLLNGGLKITRELLLDNSLVLFYSYIFATVLFFSSIVFTKLYSPRTFKFKYQAIKIGLLAGVFSFLGLQSYAIALEGGPASVVVPIFSSRNAIVAVLCIWYFKETLSRFQKMALASLLFGLLCVSF